MEEGCRVDSVISDRQYEKIKKFISTTGSEGATNLYERISRALHSGIIWINCSQPCFVQAPWGGNKRSGFGRELGEWWVLYATSKD